MATLGLDFDHTIADTGNPQPGYKMGPPLPGAVEAVRQLARTNTIIIFSARAATLEGAKSISDWLNYFGVPYQRITAIKPKDVTVFIDDRGYRFLDWDSTMRELPKVIQENHQRLGDADRAKKNAPDSHRFLGNIPLAGSPLAP